MQKKLLTAQEAKKYLRIKELKTLYKYANGGEIPAFKMGKEWRFSIKSLDKWIKEREHRTKRRKAGTKGREREND